MFISDDSFIPERFSLFINGIVFVNVGTFYLKLLFKLANRYFSPIKSKLPYASFPNGFI